MFFSGQRPAVNVGLSVSRVGGAAQTKAMKKAAGSLRVDLAQYREMEVFTQFSSDLDEETKRELRYGSGLMELLKQPMTKPLSMPEQVITLVGAIGKKFVDVQKEKIKDYQAQALEYFHLHQSNLVDLIATQKVIDDEIKYAILEAFDEFEKEKNG